MNKELRQTIGGFLIFLAVISFIALLFVPNLYEHLDQKGYSEEEATQTAGLYGTICLFSAIILMICGLGLINKWIPLILLVAWHLSDSSDEASEET